MHTQASGVTPQHSTSYSYAQAPPPRPSSSLRSSNGRYYVQETQHAPYTSPTLAASSQGPYPHYATEAEYAYRDPANRGQIAFFGNSQTPLQSQGSSYSHAQAGQQWPDGAVHAQAGTSLLNYGHAYSGNSTSVPMVRGTSAQSMGQSHSVAGQPYARFVIKPFTEGGALNLISNL